MPRQTLLFLHLLPFFVSFFFFMKSSASNNSSTSAYCQPSKCGEIEVKYPFWLQSPDTAPLQYCGYQGFGLDCIPFSISGNTSLVLHLPSDDFYVRSIDYEDHKLVLVDIDATTNLTCPRARHNLTLEDLPLKHSAQDFDLTFYFNCSDPLPPPAYPVDCLRFGGSMSYVSSETDIDFDWFKVCEEKVVATVLERETNGVDGIWASLFGTAMNDGFVLDWYEAIECAKCEVSRGRCGYNNSSKQFLCFCIDGTITHDHCKGKNLSQRLRLMLAIGISAAGALTLLVIFLFWIINKKPPFNKASKENMNLEAAIKQYGSLAPRRYSYSDIKRMTNSFKDKLGKGGYGEVYKGNLFVGRPIAVKILNTTKGSGEEFINEVVSVSRTSHVNVVTLLGFCLEGQKRALIYEFMPNGSLEKYIHGETTSKTDGHLGWAKLYQIALGIARGLEYLHRGCTTRILHFDIKPHNILLDEDFCPKISDFGLAKLCTRKESAVSMLGARGTIGYIAPELVCRNFGIVSHKSDVYSYGMMLLEMVGGRKNVSVGVSRTSEIYFPHWVYQRVVLHEDLKLQGVTTPEDGEIARKMILVGLWCIQTDPSQRPAVSKVIEMLQGSLEALEIPPKPFFCSPSRSPEASSTAIAVS